MYTKINFDTEKGDIACVLGGSFEKGYSLLFLIEFLKFDYFQIFIRLLTGFFVCFMYETRTLTARSSLIIKVDKSEI